MKCKNCGAEFEEGIFCPECGTKADVELSREEKERIELDKLEKEKAEQERLKKEQEEQEKRIRALENEGKGSALKGKKQGKMRGAAKAGLICSVLLSVVVVIAVCGGSSEKWGAEALPGKYTLSEEEEYPYISVTEYEIINEFGEEDIQLGIRVYLNKINQGLSNDAIKQREDGSYYIEGSNWSYVIWFQESGRAKVEMEETGENKIANAIAKTLYGKAVGTYKYFKEYTMTFDESIEAVYEAMERGVCEPGKIVENKIYSSTDFVEVGRTYVSKTNGEMIFMNVTYGHSYSEDDISIEAMFTQNGEIDRRSLTLDLTNTEETPQTYYAHNSEGYLEREDTLTLCEDESLEFRYTEDELNFSGIYHLATEEDLEIYHELLTQAAEKMLEEEQAAEEAVEQIVTTSIVYGSYYYDNGVDAVVEGDVGVYTDTGEDYLYLSALYYDSNHYYPEAGGTLWEIGDGTYRVVNELGNAVEFQITFTAAGMEVEIIDSETDEYDVLEGYYNLTSELNFDEVG